MLASELVVEHGLICGRDGINSLSLLRGRILYAYCGAGGDT